jgi:uncharacterized YigZ family protein
MPVIIDARHHCFAWVLGAGRDRFRAFDDGEPNHSAGDPILGQIRSRDLTNTLVVVVRYFGGVKLGVSGLINAYKIASAAALDNCEKVNVEVTLTVRLHYGYASTAEVMRLIRDLQVQITNQKFNEGCEMELQVPIRQSETFFERVRLLQATGTDVIVSS